MMICTLNKVKGMSVYMKILVADLGACGVNYQVQYLTDELSENFELTNDFKSADVIVMIGGCCCTESNLKNSLNFINYILENKKYEAITYLTGCIVRPFKDIPELQSIQRYLKDNIDYIVDYYNLNQLLKLINDDITLSNDADSYGMYYWNGRDAASFFIQNGCSHKCSFCKTNYLNFNLKDAPFENIIEKINSIDKNGIKKVELRGLNLSQYGLDMYHDYRLMDICEYIEEKTNVKSITLSGFGFSDAINAGFADRMKYFKKKYIINGSLESGSNRILELMNKGFTQEEFLRFYSEVNSIYRKDFYLNIISGFPTETVDDCHETIEVLKQVRPKIVNINTYLDSEFIPSHNLEQLSDKEISKHTKIYMKGLRNSFIRYKVNGGN